MTCHRTAIRRDDGRIVHHYTAPGREAGQIVLFSRVVQVRQRAGVCQRCGCTELMACPGGCVWADDRHTLCTACLAWACAAALRRMHP